ncbi:hypothetical protein NGTWS0302_16740 [Mycolicibacterium cyprinidarum]|uniref:Twin-arginine translocation pathway signal n=1 Tax=Mycolicibacterium cyprinidarum TaxID=2860311 RepID=A0ABQ4VGG6_9MYCO|nr:hypothetical protein NGTWS1702_24810 [Mycolicibacterium sp. NGTWSNA01]GJF18489.1 hypothetical protein NGTWS0302_16740 [Mycolicibacterium sp. NGTWS0302]
MISRRALWWMLVVVLTVAVAGAASFGTWQLVRPIPADSTQLRQTVIDIAKSSTVKLLSYTPQNVDSLRTDAVAVTTGAFRDSYSDLVNDVVIPGAKEKNITAVAQVPALAVESLTADTAVLIVFVNQTVTVGSEAPTDTASSVRERLRNVDGAWLIEAFDPL